MMERLYNPGQKTADKFAKLSKMGLSAKCFAADFLRLSSINVKIRLSGGWLGTRYQIQTFQGFS